MTVGHWVYRLRCLLFGHPPQFVKPRYFYLPSRTMLIDWHCCRCGRRAS
jgi:hypothetical protein